MIQDILERLEDSSTNESSHELACRCYDAAQEIKRLRAIKEPEVICYWNTDDTESGHSDICDITGQYSHGIVCGVDHVAIVRTTYHASLPPAADADSDDDWGVKADTADEAQAAVDAEATRRAALLTSDLEPPK